MCYSQTPYFTACGHYGKPSFSLPLTESGGEGLCIKAQTSAHHSAGCEDTRSLGIINTKGLCTNCTREKAQNLFFQASIQKLNEEFVALSTAPEVSENSSSSSTKVDSGKNSSTVSAYSSSTSATSLVSSSSAKTLINDDDLPRPIFARSVSGLSKDAAKTGEMKSWSFANGKFYLHLRAVDYADTDAVTVTPQQQKASDALSPSADGNEMYAVGPTTAGKHKGGKAGMVEVLRSALEV